MQRLGGGQADSIEWSSLRLLCIAGDFTRYDEHAVQQINRNIELLRYRKYGDELPLLELVKASVATPSEGLGGKPPEPSTNTKTVSEYLEQSPQALKDLYEASQGHC
jgi:hypothetical protein